MDSAGAALRDAAAIFGSGQSDVFPDDPEQRCVGLDVDIESFAVYFEVCHRRSPDWFNPSIELRREFGPENRTIQIKILRWQNRRNLMKRGTYLICRCYGANAIISSCAAM
jgi:hypothetical protein